jgi:hypothetical protein
MIVIAVRVGGGGHDEVEAHRRVGRAYEHVEVHATLRRQSEPRFPKHNANVCRFLIGIYVIRKIPLYNLNVLLSLTFDLNETCWLHS